LVKGSLLDEKCFALRIIRYDDLEVKLYNVAWMRRGYKDVKDVIIRLERHFSNYLENIDYVTVSKMKFFVAFDHPKFLKEFLNDEYFKVRAKESETFLELDLFNRQI
jgi:hypothetical protein